MKKNCKNYGFVLGVRFLTEILKGMKDVSEMSNTGEARDVFDLPFFWIKQTNSSLEEKKVQAKLG